MPTIPAAQVQTDWNATTGMGVLLNKPAVIGAGADAAAARTAIGAGTSSLIIGSTSTTAKKGDYVPAWSEITSKPSTFAPIIGTTATTAMAGDSLQIITGTITPNNATTTPASTGTIVLNPDSFVIQSGRVVTLQIIWTVTGSSRNRYGTLHTISGVSLPTRKLYAPGTYATLPRGGGSYYCFQITTDGKVSYGDGVVPWSPDEVTPGIILFSYIA
jgi:hypothetical protein